jgi:hypothetical protein
MNPEVRVARLLNALDFDAADPDRGPARRGARWSLPRDGKSCHAAVHEVAHAAHADSPATPPDTASFHAHAAQAASEAASPRRRGLR